MLSRKICYLLLFALFFAACEKDDVQPQDDQATDDIEFLTNADPDHPQRPGCFEIVYPVTIAFPDGTTTGVNSPEEVRQVMREWREANPGLTERPSFVYPIEVSFPDGETGTVASPQELRDLRQDCDHPCGPNWYRGRPCFNLVFPVTLSFPDGTTAEANNRLELRQLIHDWRVENPDATERPTFVFPIQVEYPNGDVATVADAESLHELRDQCDHPVGPDWQHFHPCFRLVFPVTVVFPNGNTAEVNSQHQLNHLLRVWRMTHPHSTERPTLEFPLEVQLPNGDIETVEGPAGLRLLLQNCDRPCGPFEHDGPQCFDLVFPVTLEFPDGTTAEADGPEALRQLIHDWRMENPDAEEMPGFVYPIEVETADGEIVTVENGMELRELRADCHRPCRPRPHDCFDIVFPVTVVYPDGNTAEAATPQELRELYREWREENPDAEERPTLAFPFDAELEDGSVVTVEDQEQFRMLIESCHP